MNAHQGYLDACEQEPLATCGKIQPVGALLACDPHSLQVTYVSAEIARWLGKLPKALLGARVPEPLAGFLADDTPRAGTRRYLDGQMLGDATVDMIISATEQAIVFELYPPGAPLTVKLDVVSALPASIADEQELAYARQRLVELLRQYSGFERVMFYAFHNAGDGTVLHESVADSAMGTYLGLRFPASDIPQIARRLYQKNPWRCIFDSQAAGEPVLANANSPLDLTLTDLRAASPIHQQYMQNMGVGGSVSLPVKRGETLGALISLHHAKPQRLGIQALRQLAMLVNQYTMLEADYFARLRMHRIDALNRRFARFTQRITSLDRFYDQWDWVSGWLIEEFAADGIAALIDQEWLEAGQVPEEASMQAIETCFAQHASPVWMSEYLQGDCPDLGLSAIAGLLAIRVGELPQQSQDCIYFFRGEHVHEVSWGGNPNKPTEQQIADAPIAPRRSFERWVEQRLGHSKPWPDGTRLGLLKLRVNIQQVINRGYD